MHGDSTSMKRCVTSLAVSASVAAALIIPAVATAGPGACQIPTKADFTQVFGKVTLAPKGPNGCDVRTAKYGHFVSYLNVTPASYLPRFFRFATPRFGYSRVPGLGSRGWYRGIDHPATGKHSEEALFARHGYVFTVLSNLPIGAPTPTKAQVIKLAH